jgi:hypothetical protein
MSVYGREQLFSVYPCLFSCVAVLGADRLWALGPAMTFWQFFEAEINQAKSTENQTTIQVWSDPWVRKPRGMVCTNKMEKLNPWLLYQKDLTERSGSLRANSGFAICNLTKTTRWLFWASSPKLGRCFSKFYPSLPFPAWIVIHRD